VNRQAPLAIYKEKEKLDEQNEPNALSHIPYHLMELLKSRQMVESETNTGPDGINRGKFKVI